MISPEPRQTWSRTKAHGVSVTLYLDKVIFSMEGFREELEAENEGVKIPSIVR